MKCVVLHESGKRLRVRIPAARLTLKEADVIEYYIRSLPDVSDVKVYERTSDAVIIFASSAVNHKKSFLEAMEAFRGDDESITALCPENSGRAVNREYEEKIVMKCLSKAFRTLFFPVMLNTAVCAVKSVRYIREGIRILLHNGIEVPVLDAAAITAAMLTGDFDTAGNVMFLLEIGDTLEEWTRKKSIGDLARSMSLGVENVWKCTEEGNELVPLKQVHIGDKVLVHTSDIIPLDGVVVSGEMTVNQSAMTGESEPVRKQTDSYVYAGTVVEEGECVIEITRESGTGKYDQIVRMIEESEKLKSETETKAYRLADGLVPYSFAGAGITYLLTGNVTKALSFLMVDFSCAMKMSMPVSVLSAIKEARLHGIMIKGGKFIEAAAEADTIIFDKTGTLTNACPKLVDIVAFDGNDPKEMLRIAACLEEHYPHSVANAIVQGARDQGILHDEMHGKVEYIVAHGVSSRISRKKAVIGSYHFVIEDSRCTVSEEAEEILQSIPKEYSKIYLGIGGRLMAVLCIFDPVKPEAAEIIRMLHRTGFKKVCMMTGDNYSAAQAVASKLALDDFRAEVLPEEKAEFVRRERMAGHKVIMVGDGVNDTPALSEADAGIAIADGAAIAREVSDIMIASDDLAELITLRRISEALMNRINSNYRFILGFNSALIVLGLLGVITPSSSALLHNGSTLITGLNSMTKLLPEKRTLQN